MSCFGKMPAPWVARLLGRPAKAQTRHCHKRQGRHGNLRTRVCFTNRAGQQEHWWGMPTGGFWFGPRAPAGWPPYILASHITQRFGQAILVPDQKAPAVLPRLTRGWSLGESDGQVQARTARTMTLSPSEGHASEYGHI